MDGFFEIKITGLPNPVYLCRSPKRKNGRHFGI